jgi:hypothetical protein
MTQNLAVGAATLAAFVLLLGVLFNPVSIRELGRHVGTVLAGQGGMLFQRINRSTPERVFVVAYQSYSPAAAAAGQAYQWDYATDADGVGVTRPAARATSGGFAGAGICAENSLAAGAYGLFQVYGYNAGVRMRTVTGGSPAIVPGRPLVMPVAGSVFCLESISTASKTIVSWPVGFSFGSTSGFTTASKPAFLKFL